MIKLVVGLQSKIDRMQEKMDMMEKNMENRGESEREEKTTGDRRMEEMVEKRMVYATEEQMERDRRRKNIVIVNLKESSKTDSAERKAEDLSNAKQLLEKVVTITEGELIEPIRLGKEGGNRPRMLRITVRTEEKRNEVVRNAFRVNEGVTEAKERRYINPDYTLKERERNKVLRDEKRGREKNGETNLIIRDGQIIKRRDRPSPEADTTERKNDSVGSG